MAFLVTLQGPNTGQRFTLEGDAVSIGRQPDCAIYLESLAVSRQHAQVLREDQTFWVEDVGSSNGTFLNGKRLDANRRRVLEEKDTLQIGPYVLGLRRSPKAPRIDDTNTVIRAQVEATPSNSSLFEQNSTYKLQKVLAIAQHLGHHLDIDALLTRLLEDLFLLFPQADRGIVLLCEQNLNKSGSSNPLLRVQTQRTRSKDTKEEVPYSRSVVRRALAEGIGLLSENVGEDPNLALSSTVFSLDVRSFLCVPLVGKEGKRLGVIQLDAVKSGSRFTNEDLELLTAISLHAAVVLENARLHEQQVRQARLQQELLLAREIQQSFLPSGFAELEEGRQIELFAEVQPAREVSGDLYDIFPLLDGRLAFYLGDVSGKGMPAALFMIAVRTLARHLGNDISGPADLLRRLHAALVVDNPTALFVTLACGIYEHRDRRLLLASAAHPSPILRRADGSTTAIDLAPTSMLANSLLTPQPVEESIELAVGDTLILYSDGMVEGMKEDETQFGFERLCETLSGEHTSSSLQECARGMFASVPKFTRETTLQDDRTLLLLRRRP